MLMKIRHEMWWRVYLQVTLVAIVAQIGVFTIEKTRFDLLLLTCVVQVLALEDTLNGIEQTMLHASIWMQLCVTIWSLNDEASTLATSKCYLCAIDI